MQLSGSASVGERDLLLFGALGGRGLSRYTADLTGSGLDAVVGADGRLDALDLHGGFVGYTHYWSELAIEPDLRPVDPGAECTGVPSGRAGTAYST